MRLRLAALVAAARWSLVATGATLPYAVAHAF
jgi:hypothetical protein